MGYHKQPANIKTLVDDAPIPLYNQINELTKFYEKTLKRMRI